MELEKPPTAIFASNNLMSMGCLKYFREHEIEMGRNIRFVGYDDIPELSCAGFYITCVDRPAVKMGEEAMDLICERFSVHDNSSKVHKRVIIGTNLIIRGSEKIGE